MSANFRCVRPGCGLVTHFYDPTIDDTINIQGQAAHKHAASRLGPRADVELSVEQRRSYRNGVWLCANCATLIDRLPEDHPVSLLTRWQEEAVERIRRTGLGASRHIPHDPRSDSQAVGVFLEKIPATVLRGWKPGESISYEAVEALTELYRSGLGKGPGNKMLAIQHSIRNRQVCIIELAHHQIKAIQSRGRGYDNILADYTNTIVGYRPITNRTANEDEARFYELQRLVNELRDYLNGPPLTLSDADW
nr:hypothetical protein [uncultured Comamonas sp.]